MLGDSERRARVICLLMSVATAFGAREARSQGVPVQIPRPAQTGEPGPQGRPWQPALPVSREPTSTPYWFPMQYQAPILERELVFESDSATAVLELWGDSSWRELCRAPCAVRMRVGDYYRVGGPGIRTSRVYAVRPNTGPLFVHAEARTITPGIFVLIVGATTITTGLFIWSDATNPCHPCDDDQARIGVSLAAVGLPIIVLGIVLLSVNRTVLHFAPRPSTPALGVEIVPNGFRF